MDPSGRGNKERIMKKLRLIAMIFVSTFPVPAQQVEKPNLVLVRNEDNGKMNILPCRLYIENDQGVSVLPEKVSVIDLSGKQAPNRVRDKFVYLVGGDTANYTLKSGTYRILVKTPLSEQDRYLEAIAKDWVSEKKLITIPGNGIERFYIVPKSEESFYSGGWLFSTRSGEE